MPPAEQDRARNKLLSAMLSIDAAAALVSEAVAVPLEGDQAIFDAGDRVDALCFPADGVVSVCVASGTRTIEVAMVGRDGFLGTGAYLGQNRSMLRATVLQPGTGFVLRADKVRDLAAAESRVAALLNWSVAVQFKTLAQSSFCRSTHHVQQQVAQWLLMYLDRVDDRSLKITQGTLAQALGVRRASVTEVARRLQGQGAIDYRPGAVVILDRAKLESASCECYRAIRDIELEAPEALRTDSTGTDLAVRPGEQSQR